MTGFFGAGSPFVIRRSNHMATFTLLSPTSYFAPSNTWGYILM